MIDITSFSPPLGALAALSALCAISSATGMTMLICAGSQAQQSRATHILAVSLISYLAIAALLITQLPLGG